MVVFSGLADTFGEYGRLVDAMAPGLNAHLQQEDPLADRLFELVLCAAAGTVKE